MSERERVLSEKEKLHYIKTMVAQNFHLQFWGLNPVWSQRFPLAYIYLVVMRSMLCLCLCAGRPWKTFWYFLHFLYYTLHKYYCNLWNLTGLLFFSSSTLKLHQLCKCFPVPWQPETIEREWHSETSSNFGPNNQWQQEVGGTQDKPLGQLPDKWF